MATTTRRSYTPGGYAVSVHRSYAGRGLFADEAIPSGICIIEYTGRPITKEEEYSSRSKYLFEVNKNLTIDGATHGNIARYINHACKPNCEPVIYKNRVYVFSTRRIRAGEELTYDYGEAYFKQLIEPKGCRCAACAAPKPRRITRRITKP